MLQALVPIYGTKDAGRGLWRRVVRICTQEAGLKENFVFLAFYTHAVDGRIVLMLATHVDDFLWANTAVRPPISQQRTQNEAKNAGHGGGRNETHIDYHADLNERHNAVCLGGRCEAHRAEWGEAHNAGNAGQCGRCITCMCNRRARSGHETSLGNTKRQLDNTGNRMHGSNL